LRTVGNNTDDDFLPTFWTPRLGSAATAEVGNIFDHAEHILEEARRMMAVILTYAFIVLTNRNSSSLYIVITMKSSV
jgi:hypothetical protein